MMDNRTPLMKKLAEILPEAPKRPAELWAARIEVDHIRMAADTFAHLIDKDLPKDGRELRDTLYVFGQMLHGDMQRRLKHMQDLNAALLNTSAPPWVMIEEEISIAEARRRFPFTAESQSSASGPSSPPALSPETP